MFRSIDDFASTWTQESEGTLKVLRSLTDESLAQRVAPGGRTLGFLAWHITCTLTGDRIPMYGEQWTRGFVLQALVAHQTHHRGQMTVLMRQAGLPVPGMYGPSKEEWAAMGMPPMA
jgi:uncharacterized damage-inducible protein DinB